MHGSKRSLIVTLAVFRVCRLPNIAQLRRPAFAMGQREEHVSCALLGRSEITADNSCRVS